MTGKCCACLRVRPVHELLRIERLADRAARYVCRPTLGEPGPMGQGPCFRAGVGARSVDAIVAAALA